VYVVCVCERARASGGKVIVIPHFEAPYRKGEEVRGGCLKVARKD
jgi:hypothetical protein